MDDPLIYELAVKQGRIILTTNVKDFRPLLREDSAWRYWNPRNLVDWSNRYETSALLMKNCPNYFKGQFRSLGAEDALKRAA
jgi:hypothetical protein